MRRYYKNAEVVLVVLDTSKGDYNLRALEVKDLECRMDSEERMHLLLSCPERVAGECLQSEGVTIYDTLCKMSKAEWFKRGWTLQEVLLAKDIIIWNGSTSVSGTIVRKCVDWLGNVTPDVTNGLEFDEDYSVLQSIFHVENNNILFESPFEAVDQLMEGRRCTKDEDYVYSILGLLEVDIKIEYDVPLHVCKRRLFSRLVQEQRAAGLFTHTGIGVFPIHNEYGTSFISDYPRSDRVVYSLSREGVKFAGCGVYVYEIIGSFYTNSFNKSDPVRNLWEITRMLGDDLSGYKNLVRALYSITGTDDDEFITTKSEWFGEMARALAPIATAELLPDVPVNSDCILLHSLLNRPQTPLVSYGMVHNNISVCAYIFTCLEAVPEDGKCLLLAPGIIGKVHETGILCSGLNLHGRKQRKIGATLNLNRSCLDSIVHVANLPEVIVANNKFRRHSVANLPEVIMGNNQFRRHSM